MRLLLIDATGYLFRAFHALGDMSTAQGVPTGAVDWSLCLKNAVKDNHEAKLRLSRAGAGN